VIPADGVPEALLVDNAGRRLYVPAQPSLSLATELRVYDLDSLELVAKSRSYEVILEEATWEFDPMRQQILLGTPFGANGTSALTLDAD
jgi:hypothetical protein